MFKIVAMKINSLVKILKTIGCQNLILKKIDHRLFVQSQLITILILIRMLASIYYSKAKYLKLPI